MAIQSEAGQTARRRSGESEQGLRGRGSRVERTAPPDPADPRSCAVGYLRRSTDRQEQSIGDQRAAVERYAAEIGVPLTRLYIDDAISGASTAGRRAFQSMIEDAGSEARGFGMVIVYDIKRFGRIDNDEAGYYRHLLRQRGVEVRYASEGFTGDSTDDLLRPVKQWQARQESKDLAKVVIRGLVSKAGVGREAGRGGSGGWMGGAAPFGYDLKYLSGSGDFIFVVRTGGDGSKALLDAGGGVRGVERAEGEVPPVRARALRALREPVRGRDRADGHEAARRVQAGHAHGLRLRRVHPRRTRGVRTRDGVSGGDGGPGRRGNAALLRALRQRGGRGDDRGRGAWGDGRRAGAPV
ncbi:MAG TPA: hypothetical protein DEB06_08320 [Phycisphaerales bacterium]|nr:hypothetical protein [Phycisphaerales bacterium]